MAINYVKFQRGTKSAYQSLKTANKLDGNTLYFIYDASDTTGELYLGSRLISSVGQGTAVTKLSELTDVLYTESSVIGNQILITNSEGKWINKDLSEIANLIAGEEGLGFTANDKIFTLTPVNDVPVLNLQGFDAADNGAFAMKGSDGTLTWGTPDLSNLVTATSLQTELATINGNIDTKIAAANHLTYKKVDDISKVTDANIIYLIANEETEGNNLYNEYMLLDNKVELIGDFTIDTSEFVTPEALQTAISNVETQLNDYATLDGLNDYALKSVVGDLSDLLYPHYETGSTTTTIIQELNALNEQMIWKEIANS